MFMFSSRFATMLSIFLMCAASYLIFFRGDIITIDEMLLFDMTESIARRGNLNETLTYSLSQFRPIDHPDLFGSSDSYEPLQPNLAAPLFLMGQQIPDANLMHIVWLFNVVVVALIPVVFFWGVEVLGYDHLTAWFSATLAGLGTLLMPYSRTFFREPLMTLCLTVAIVLALKIHRVKKRLPWQEGLLLLCAMVAAVSTKAISVLFLPVIGLLLFRAKYRDWLMLGAVGLVGLIGVGILMQSGLLENGRFSTERWQGIIDDTEWRWVSESTRGYLISPGRGFFWFSPVLLLSPWGMWLLWRRGEWRLVLSMLGTLAMFAVGYGVLRAGVWTGGLSLGPRYLLPLIPLFAFSLPPVIDHLRSHPQWRAVRWLVVAIACFSIGLQLLFSSNSEADIDFSGSEVWHIESFAAWQYVQNINFDALDIVWRYSSVSLVLGIGFASVALIEIAFASRSIKAPLAPRMFASSMVLLLLLSVGVISIRDDPRFFSDDEDLNQLFGTLQSVTMPDDAIVVRDDRLGRIFGATYIEDNVVFTLPHAPGETYGVTPLVTEGSLAELAGPHTVRLYDYIAVHHEHLWMVSDLSPFLPGVRRPAEHYLVEHYYPFWHADFSDDIRLLGFYMHPASNAPTQTTDIRFDGLLLLSGVDIPLGNTYHTGDLLPVSVWMSALDIIDRDYTIALQLAAPSGQLVTQYDRMPVGDFMPTSTWIPGELYRDNRALQIPADLSPGNYQLQVVVYFWETLERLVLDNGDDIIRLQQISVIK